MVNEDLLTDYSYLVSARFEAINTHYLKLMGKQIKEIGKLNPSSLRKLEQMNKMGYNISEINRILAAESGKSLEELYRVYDMSNLAIYDDLAKTLKSNKNSRKAFRNNAYLQGQINSIKALTGGTFNNLANTTVVSKQYQQVIDTAIQAVMSGQTDYYSAIRNQMNLAAEEGLSVTYASGLTRRLDSAVRMNVLDGIRQMGNATLDAAGEEFGADGYEITAHSLCAEDHIEIQGRQFAKGDNPVTVDGKIYPSYNQMNGMLKRKLTTCNCKHRRYPIILGISEPAYTDEELKQRTDASREPVTITVGYDKDGNAKTKVITRYEATQMQRNIETNIRRAKDRHILSEAAGDTVGTDIEKQRIRLLNRAYRQLSSEAGLAPKWERTFVAGYTGKQTPPNPIRINPTTLTKNAEKPVKSKADKVVTPKKEKTVVATYKPKYKDSEIKKKAGLFPTKNPEIREMIEDAMPYDEKHQQVKLLYGEQKDELITKIGDKVRLEIKDALEKAVSNGMSATDLAELQEEVEDLFDTYNLNFSNVCAKISKETGKQIFEVMHDWEDIESTVIMVRKSLISGNATMLKEAEILIDAAVKSTKYSKYWEELLPSFREYILKNTAMQDAQKAVKGLTAVQKEQIVKDVLHKYRSLGGVDVSKHIHGDQIHLNDIRDAYECYPKEWIKASVDRSQLNVIHNPRGYYSENRRTIALSGPGNGDYKTHGTAVHEIAHRMEYTNNYIREAERFFYSRRTKGCTLEWLGPGYDIKEVTRKDHFLHPYMGKDYGGSAYELVSMGYQYLFTNIDELLNDEDYANFIIGTFIGL